MSPVPERFAVAERMIRSAPQIAIRTDGTGDIRLMLITDYAYRIIARLDDSARIAR